MTRDQMKALLPDGTDDAVVTALLDAMHAEITPYKDAAFFEMHFCVYSSRLVISVSASGRSKIFSFRKSG